MTNLLISAEKREILGKKVNELREQGKIPAVLYGHKVENVNLVINYNDFEKIYKQAGESTLIDLKISSKDKPVKVLIHDVQYDPVKHVFVHVDFYQVKMDEKITTSIPFIFVNEAPAVKELGGILIKNTEEIEVKCLPADLIKEIQVDISSLKTFDDSVRVKDLSISSTIEVLVDPETVVVTIAPPRIEEVEPVKEEVEAEEGEAAEEEKKEKTGEPEETGSPEEKSAPSDSEA